MKLKKLSVDDIEDRIGINIDLETEKSRGGEMEI